MPKVEKPLRKSRTHKCEELFLRASSAWDNGRLKSAFKFFLLGAKAGDPSCQVNVGYFYDRGFGVSPNRSLALYWYRRAYRRGSAGAANNIGTIWRDAQKPQRALSWFRRAVELGEDGSNLEIAKHYLRVDLPQQAITYLKKVSKSDRVTEGEEEEAKRLLKETEKRVSAKGGSGRASGAKRPAKR